MLLRYLFRACFFTHFQKRNEIQQYHEIDERNQHYAKPAPKFTKCSHHLHVNVRVMCFFLSQNTPKKEKMTLPTPPTTTERNNTKQNKTKKSIKQPLRFRYNQQTKGKTKKVMQHTYTHCYFKYFETCFFLVFVSFHSVILPFNQ